MPPFSVVSLAFGAACLSGVNCYLTVFLAGLAGKLGWLPPGGAELLAHPAVMAAALALYFLEVVVDKIPVLDSLWDVLHTLIRPAVGVLLALALLGPVSPEYAVAAGLLAGVAAPTAHLGKSCARVLINNRPGPAGNILASIGEDLAVAGVFLLTVHQPVPGFVICAVLLAALWVFSPQLVAAGRAGWFLLWKKVRLPAGSLDTLPVLTEQLPAGEQILVHAAVGGPGQVQWTVRCITGRVRGFPGLPAARFGTLVKLREHPEKLVFLGRRWFRPRAAVISVRGCEVQQESGFLSEDLVIFHRGEKRVAAFRFTRMERALVAHLAGLTGTRRGDAGGAHEMPQATAEPVPEAAPAPGVMAEEWVPATAELPRDIPAGPGMETVLPAPIFIEAPGPLPVAPFTPLPESIQPFPAGEADAVVAVRESGLVGREIADVPPMPPLPEALAAEAAGRLPG